MAGCRPKLRVLLFLTCVVVLTVTMSTSPAQAEDATLIIPGDPSAAAPYCDLVEAVLSKFSLANIFPDDNGFLRRVAYAESAGTISPTVGQGGHGPWAAKRFMLNITQTTDNTSSDFQAVDPLRQAILSSTAFRNGVGGFLDWQQVPFELLQIPLLSALAVRLYLHILISRDAASLSAVPLRLDSQATLWAKNFAEQTDKDLSSADEDRRAQLFVNRTRQFDDECACNANVDMSFVLDMSGSVRRTGFAQSTAFAAAIASSFNVGPNATRIGLVTFSTNPVLNFPLDHYNTTDSVADAIRNARYLGGRTRTARAISAMIKYVFMLNNTVTSTSPAVAVTTATPTTTPAETTTAPATTVPPFFDQLPDFPGGGGVPSMPGLPTSSEPPVTSTDAVPTVAPIYVQPRIGIVITDGKSMDNVLPISQLAHNLGITMFAIGVGNINQQELEEIASDPDEAHVYKVNDFSVIENIRTSIRERTCRSPAPVDLEQPVGGSLTENETQFVTVPIPPEDPPVTTVTITSQAGDLGFFASFSFPNPNAALNDASGEVLSGQTAHFLVTDEQAIENSAASAGRRRRRRDTASSDKARQLYISIVARSDTAQFLMQAQSGNVIPTTATEPAPTVMHRDTEQSFGSTGAHLPTLSIFTLIMCAVAVHLAGN
eukprot:scpid48154/ scgid23218/ Collagen alpha-1(XXII) chain